MEKHLIFDTSSNTRHDYIDAHGESYTPDYVQDATPFDSLEDAQAYIDRNGWQSWAVPTPAPTNDMDAERDSVAR